MPRTFHAVSANAVAIATSWPCETGSPSAEKAGAAVPSAGKKEPRNSANAVERAATVPGITTKTSAHMYRKPQIAPNVSERYTYGPPAVGRRAPSSAYVRPAAAECTAPSTQTTTIQEGKAALRITFPADRKIPLPIMEPAT